MKAILKVARYTSFDLVRSRWTFAYGIFFLAFVGGLFAFGEEPSRAIVSVLNLVLIVVPLVSSVFGVTHFYSSRAFVELLLTQPIDRKSVFWGQYIGLSLSLALAFTVGLTGPFLWYGLQDVSEIGTLGLVLLSGVLLTMIFVGLASVVSVLFDDQVRAVGLVIFAWLYFAVLYDGLLLVFILLLQAYPLEKALIGLAILNPLDISRILILLRLDISTLMGYTGALFRMVFGGHWGAVLAVLSLVVWAAIPVLMAEKCFTRKDF
jgi:Cu-processing system permease protein